LFGGPALLAAAHGGALRPGAAQRIDIVFHVVVWEGTLVLLGGKQPSLAFPIIQRGLNVVGGGLNGSQLRWDEGATLHPRARATVIPRPKAGAGRVNGLRPLPRGNRRRRP